jgi:MFS family permease
MSDLVSWSRIKNLPGPAWVLLLGNFFVRGSYFMVWPFISVLLYQKFKLSATEIGLWLTSAALLAVVLGFYAGYLSDRFGRYPLLLAAAALGTVAFSCFALVQSKAGFICCIFLSTLPRALWDAPSKAWLGDSLPDPKDRELALQGLYFMVNAGAAIGPLLGLSAGMTGNPLAFLITALSYFLLGVAVLFFRRQPKPLAQKYNPMRFGQTLFLLKKDQLFLLVIVANILVTFIYAHGDSSLIQYLTRAEVPELVGLISAMIILNSTVIVLFQFPLLRLMASWSVVSRIYVGLLLLAASQLGFALNPPTWFWGWIVAVFILSLGEAVLFANMNVHLDQLAPASLRGSYFGAASLYAIGYSLSPVVGGLILDLWGGPTLFAISFSLCLAVFFSYQHSGKLKRPDFVQLEQDWQEQAKQRTAAGS